MKRVLFVLVLLASALCFSACGKSSDGAVAAASVADPGATANSGSDPKAGAHAKAPLQPALPQGLSECAGSAVEDAIAGVNVVRAQYQAQPLTQNTDLMEAARQRVFDMARNNVLTHDGWDVTLRAFSYLGSLTGENIAEGQKDAATVVDSWVHSPHHFANMINQAYTETGLGCVVDQSGVTWWSQDFGRP